LVTSGITYVLVSAWTAAFSRSVFTASESSTVRANSAVNGTTVATALVSFESVESVESVETEPVEAESVEAFE
jgi:hypothetical protein